jgi:hypothetical protein
VDPCWGLLVLQGLAWERNGSSSGMNDPTAENILDRLSDLKNHPLEALAPYEEFEANGSVYYFTPGGYLYRKDPGAEEVGGFFCGYLTDEAWHHRTDDG